MSNKKRLLTVFSLLSGLFLAYSSFFYFPSYTLNTAFANTSAEARDVPGNEQEKSSDLISDLNHLVLNRGYIKAGQTVSTDYILSPGLRLNIIVTKCAGPIIFEVYSCRGSIVDSVEIGSALSGRIDLTLPSNGFYQFNEEVLKSQVENPEFQVVWKRL